MSYLLYKFQISVFIPNNNSALHEDEFARRAIEESLLSDAFWKLIRFCIVVIL